MDATIESDAPRLIRLLLDDIGSKDLGEGMVGTRCFSLDPVLGCRFHPGKLRVWNASVVQRSPSDA